MTDSTPSATLTAIQEAARAAQAYPRTINLPSGLVIVQSRNLKAKDLVEAQRVAGQLTDIEQSMVMIAQVISIQGVSRAVVLEDLQELDLDDMIQLTEAVVGKSPSSTRKR